jgi:hypothetical protein
MSVRSRTDPAIPDERAAERNATPARIAHHRLPFVAPREEVRS